MYILNACMHIHTPYFCCFSVRIFQKFCDIVHCCGHMHVVVVVVVVCVFFFFIYI